MLKNALGKAHSKNKKGKACLRTIEQEDIALVGARIDQIAADIEAGVYQALISKINIFDLFLLFLDFKKWFLKSLKDRT